MLIRPDVFRDLVVAKFALEGEDTKLSLHDEQVIAAALRYEVGPIDTAYQIVSDRDEVSELARQETECWE